MEPTTILAGLGFGGILLVVLAAFMFHRSVRSIRETGRYTAPPRY